MHFPLPLRPDPMPLREALRGLRHVLRRGGEALRDTVSPDGMPHSAAADVAGGVLREVEHLARGVDEATSGVLKRVLGGEVPPGVSLRGLAEGDAAAAVFGAAAYAALDRVVARLGAEGAFVSEATCRAAWAAGPPGDTTPEARAAALTRWLVAARPVRGISADAGLRVGPEALVPIAVFAVMLWLLSDRPEGEDSAALEASVELSIGIAAEVLRSVGAAGPEALEALYAEFAPHV